MTNATMQALETTLAAVAGPEARPREDQVAAVAALVDDRERVLCVQATGWGKSLVYWAATLALRAAGSGPTVVVSPLLALMRDQVAAAGRAGLVAGTIHSANRDEWDELMGRWRSGALDVVLVSPERLAALETSGELDSLVGACGMLVIDEAHCISDWGHEFRPDYRRLAGVLVRLAGGTPVLATTATANDRVCSDIAAQLGAASVTLRGTLARRSLRLGVTESMSPLARYAWVESALSTLDGSGIIYVLTTKEAERLAGYLAGRGVSVAAYHGALEPEARSVIEDQLRANELKAVVATSALGMGYDKGDLAFCIHLGVPPSPVAYYQQIGRAGRALDDAVVVAVPSAGDERLWEWYQTSSVPDPTQVAAVLAALNADGPQSVVGLESVTGVRRTRIEALCKLLAVDGVLTRNGSRWSTTGVEFLWDQAHWDALAALRSSEATTMRGYLAGTTCLLAALQGALDDPAAEPCGRCSVCTGQSVVDVMVTDEQLAAVQTHLRGGDLVLEARRRWPAGSKRTGTIVALEAGRALGFADDPAWQGELTTFSQGEVTADLVAGVVATLGRWRGSWRERPTSICILPSGDSTRDRALAKLADELGRIGKLPVLSPFTWSGPRPDGISASGATVGMLDAALTCAGPIEGPLLLLTATWRSGWTATVAGALLREAGASFVYPLAVHQLA